MAGYREWRLPCALKTTVRVGASVHRLVMTSVSETGCAFAQADLPVGTAVTMDVDQKQIRGQVVRMDARGCGVTFARRLAHGEVTRIVEGSRAPSRNYTELR